ncbi:uncharacterized protein TNCV_2582731 [Trichonephila clavipes]|nr:uncharacterized protein TNCV_2582731 [Trichonephila clavipes]
MCHKEKKRKHINSLQSLNDAIHWSPSTIRELGHPVAPTGGEQVADACSTRGLLATDHVILNHGQVTWTTPELAPPLLTPTPHQREDVSALDRFNVHRCPTRRVFNGIGLELVARQATVRYLYHYRGRPLCRRLNLKADV